MSQVITKFIANLAVTNAKIANATIDLTTKVTGILPIANGGSGSATTSQSFAFIGPTSGSGAPSFRALVAGDIPSLAYANQALSNLTSTAVNADIIPGVDNTINLGGIGLAYATGYINQILNSAGTLVLDSVNRILSDEAGVTAIEFTVANRLLVDSAGVNAIAFNTSGGPGAGNRMLFDNSGAVALNFKQRLLVDPSAVEAMNWSSRVLEDSAGVVALNWSDPNTIIIPPNTGGSTPRAIEFRNGGDTNGSFVRANTSIVADTLFQLPPDNGTSGYVLRTDGTGVTSWVPAASSSNTNNKETFVLSSTDITHQYVDLAHVALTNSITFMVKGAPSLLEGASYDYSVSYTGGAGGNTRITFLNDLATGGTAALVAGDVVQVQYEY